MDYENIGMERDELLRLKQISGLAELFANKDFTIPPPKPAYLPNPENPEESAVKTEVENKLMNQTQRHGGTRQIFPQILEI